MIINPEHASTIIVVESELDALLLSQECDHSCCIIALGGTNTNVDLTTHNLLQKANRIIIMMDSDNAGMLSAKRLSSRYPQSQLITLPYGKDPTEAYQKGLDLQSWLHELLS